MANTTKKYVSLTRLSNFLDNIKTKYSQIGHKHTISEITDYKVDTKLSSTSTNPVANSTLDAEFESVATAMKALESTIDSKANSSHNHDDRYYTETEIDTKVDDLQSSLDDKSDIDHKHTGITNGDYGAIMQNNAFLPMAGDGVSTIASGATIAGNTDINLGSTAKMWNVAYVDNIYLGTIGGYIGEILGTKDTVSSVNSKISTHNTSTSAHNDIRILITDLTTKLNNFLDVDDTTTDQLSEVLTLINNNKGALESLTTNKINVSDIVNNLTTNSSSKILSAAQGVAIKNLIDVLQTEVDGKAASVHTHAISDVTNLQSSLDAKVPTSRTVNGKALSSNITLSASDVGADTSGSADAALSSAQTYTDQQVAQKTQVQLIIWGEDD